MTNYLMYRIGYPEELVKKVEDLLAGRLQFYRNHFLKSKSRVRFSFFIFLNREFPDSSI